VAELVAFDIETTGLNPRTARIIEVGGVKFEDGQVVDMFQSLVRPGRAVPKRVRDLTGISQSDVDRAPAWSSVMAQLEAFVGGLPLISHRTEFEQGFLWPHKLFTSNRWIDTLDLARERLPQLKSHTLGAVADHLGIPFPVQHRALQDAYTSYAIYAMLEGIPLALPLSPPPVPVAVPVLVVEEEEEELMASLAALREVQRAVRIVGDGLAFSGPCFVTHIIMWPDADADYADVYDGRDATSGKKFCRVERAAQNTAHISLGQGAYFDVGIYVDGKGSAVETTVVFIPL